MGWNYRVMRSQLSEKEGGGSSYGIYEVYYAKDGLLEGWTSEASDVYGETIDELISALAWIITALTKPILDHANGQEVEPAKMLADDLKIFAQEAFKS